MDSLKDCFRCRDKLHAGNVQGILQKYEQWTVHYILLPPPRQWSIGSMQKISKHTIKKCLDTNQINLALLQIWSTPVGTGLPSPVTMLLNRQMWGLLLQMNGEAINVDNDTVHYEALEAQQKKYNKDFDPQKIPFFFFFFCRSYISNPLGRWGTMYA